VTVSPRRFALLGLCAALTSVGIASAASSPTQPGLAAWLSTHASGQAAAAGSAVPAATPRAHCGPGSSPETGRQGRVPAIDYSNGRAA
jgi:hypothetical protein